MSKARLALEMLCLFGLCCVAALAAVFALLTLPYWAWKARGQA